MAPSYQYLVVGPAWVGDMVMAQSLFKMLRDRKPDCAIDVLAPSWSHPLLSRMPEVRNAIALPVGHGELGLTTRYRLGKRCRIGYDQAVVLPRSLKAALLPFFARIPRRTGYKGEMRYGLINDMRTLDKVLLPQMAQRYVALGLEPGDTLPPPTLHPQLRVDQANAKRLMDSHKLIIERPVIGMMPGAQYGPAKQWPADYFASLICRLIDDGLHVWLFGSNEDQPVAEQIVQLAGGKGHNLCGITRLEDAIDLIAQTNVVVTNDSGLMHVAAAVGRPLVAIYGSSTPKYTPALTDSATLIHLGLECSPCFKRTCPLGHTRCLWEISVGRVYKAVQSRL